SAVLNKFKEVFSELDDEVRDSLAMVYFHTALNNGNVAEARNWLARMNGAGEMAHQTRLQLADYYYQIQKFEEAVIEAYTVKDLRQARPSDSVLDVQVCQLLGRA